MNKNKMTNITVFIGLIVSTMTIPFIIYAIVYGIGEAPVYEKKDVLAYYGSIAGACFGGFITAAGLYYTLQQNAETFNDQRKIDKDNRDEDKVNSVMPVLKIDNYNRSTVDKYMATENASSDILQIYMKNIGVGPAINVKVKLGTNYANNSAKRPYTFDLGVDELVTVKINTDFSKIQKKIGNDHYIKIILECTDVYNKKLYKQHINCIKPNGYSNFEIFENERKEIVTI
ncbi:hypothetical protein ACUH7Y_09545 [Clostridium beijerinckii]|uniref:Uncharacterized protein n=1 Tax=Clostridium beijerinckii TaxID=1520 RepID=A0A7X9SMC4_CLOBE|nr:hypothetical protein [Clostridium beijerinckii]NMF04556.1 hypothetical protein [Clostridium beijerinckii]